MSVNPDVLKQYGTSEALTTRRSLYQCIVGKSLTENLIDCLGLGNQMNFLDVGCGYGADIATFLGRYPELKATGIDTSVGQINDAQAKTPQATFLVENASTFRLDEKFDRILVRHVLHLVEDPGATIQNIASHLKHDGRVIFVIHSTRSQPKYSSWLAWFEQQTGISYISPSDAFTVDKDVALFSSLGGKMSVTDVVQKMKMTDPDPYVSYIKSQKRWSREPSENELNELLEYVRLQIQTEIDKQGHFEDVSINGIVVLEN